MQFCEFCLKNFRMTHIKDLITLLPCVLVCICAREVLLNETDVDSLNVHTLPNTSEDVLVNNHTTVEPGIEEPECDCGSYGTCRIVVGNIVCNCYPGFSPRLYGSKLICAPCTCGPWSIDCSFDGPKKVCTCREGASMKDAGSLQICFPCSCGEAAKNCTFNVVGDKRCDCLPGYEYTFFECEDINECQRASLHNCPSSTECINTIGSYRCVCKPGFQRITVTNFDSNIDQCEDINECQSWSACDHLTENCINTYGSYYCRCLEGLQHDSVSNLCISPNAVRPWRTAYIILSVVLGVIILSMLLYARQRYLSR